MTTSPELDQLRQQFGYRFARPYLQMNMSDFQNAYRTLAGNLGAWGCVVNGGAFREDPLTAETGLVIASVLGPETVHEIVHTLDPYLNERNPQDAVLEEFAAYYRETYVPRIYTQKTTSKDGTGHTSEPVVTRREVYENLRRIKATLKSGNYVPKYAPAFADVATYEKRVDDIAATLEKLEEFMDKPAINKAILNSQKVSELNHLLEVVIREHGKN